MKKIGIITYHAAYNYGSALQAYATQKVVEEITNQPVQIINYRPREQKRVYSLYRTMHGPRIYMEDLSLLPLHNKRKKRKLRFESFFSMYMNLSKKVDSYEKFKDFYNDYDVIISGSDQIWNKHSLELENVAWEEMYPYLLKDYMGKKISYASSIGNMSEEELEKIIQYIEQFHSVSCREATSADRIARITSKKPIPVLDPTFLLEKEQWTSLLDLKTVDDKYILFYGLGGIGYLSRVLKILNPYCKQNGLKLKIVMPYAFLPFQGENVIFCTDAGPIEFLNLIKNAKIVITNSYHGTILSVNFHKDIYSICGNSGSEFRKTELLKKIGLEDRIINKPSDFCNCLNSIINYEIVENCISGLRKKSKKYLEDAIKRK